jgi:AraC-like DNA-binding protein
MDVLTDVLQTLRVSAACYGRLELGAPWGIAVGAGEDAKFHVVVHGSCWLEVEGQKEMIPLSSGDLVAVPRGHAHVLRDERRTQPVPLSDLISDRRCIGDRVLHTGGDGITTSLISGRFRFEDPRENPLLAALPPVVALLGQEGRSVPWLEPTLRFIACEAASNRPGAQTVISRLADVLFIQIVRGYLAQLPVDSRGWLRALVEPQISTALSLVHEHPEQAWTVASLAAKVGMSRSAFAARFTQLVGEPPLHYVTRWRMQKAAKLLREERVTLADIAARVGYDSEAAFSKAFKRALGESPGAYRRAARGALLSAAA